MLGTQGLLQRPGGPAGRRIATSTPSGTAETGLRAAAAHPLGSRLVGAGSSPRPARPLGVGCVITGIKPFPAARPAPVQNPASRRCPLRRQ